MTPPGNPPSPPTSTRRRRGAGWSLLAAGALVAASAVSTATPAVAAPGDASATGASIALGLELARQTLLDEQLALATATAPAGGGTDRDAVVPLDIDEDVLGLRAEVITAEASRTGAGSDARAEVADVLLRLGDTEILAAELLTADAVCPADGPTSGDADVLGLRLGGQELANADLPTAADIPVDLELIPDVVDADARVQLHQLEETDADGAHATALVARIDLEVQLAGEDLLRTHVGEIVLADARCERPADGGGTDADGTDADGTDADGTDADGTDGTDGTDADGTDGLLPGLPGTDDGDDTDGTDADGTDADGTDADGTDGTDADGTDGLLPGLPGTDDGDGPGAVPGLPDDDDDRDGPSADGLSPDQGPATGGTTVTVEGRDLDRTDSVTVDGTEVGFEVGRGGTELTFVTPPGDEGAVDVVVTFEDGETSTLPFTYTSADGTDTTGDSTVLGDTTGTDAGTAAPGLPVTGAQSAPATLALALLLLTGGAWLLAWRDQRVTVA